MTSVSEKQPQYLSFEGLGGSRLIDMGADWLQKELQRAKLISQAATPEAMNYGKSLHTLLLELITGTYTERFMDPLTHNLLQEKMKGPVFQSFVYGRLGKLAMVKEFNRQNQSELFYMVFNTSTTPWLVSEREGKAVGGPGMVYLATTPNEKDLSANFKANHWMLLLFFVINSFQLKGYDNNLITS